MKIEANSLSLNEVRDVINGHLVIGNQKEIQEVKNPYAAYEKISEINPSSVDDLKKIHGIMTHLTVEESGVFRKDDEGVFSGDKCIFVAPPPNMVSSLMKDLLSWIKEYEGKVHPLIISAVFHYEFVFIHPFADDGVIIRTSQLRQAKSRLALICPNFLLYRKFRFLKHKNKTYVHRTYDRLKKECMEKQTMRGS